MLGAAVLAHAEPGPVAFLCPACFGFERLQGNVFLERGASASQRTQVSEAVTQGEAKVVRFFGSLRTSPTIFACFTETCSRRLGMQGEKGRTFGNFGLELAPLGLDAVIVAHERTHAEFHDRVGLMRFSSVPAWFDEGLAVLVSDDLRYLLPSTAPDRCLVEPAADLPVDAVDWGRRAAAGHALYAQAACRVFRWLEPRGGGRDAVLALVGRIVDDESFETAFSMAPSAAAAPREDASAPAAAAPAAGRN